MFLSGCTRLLSIVSPSTISLIHLDVNLQIFFIQNFTYILSFEITLNLPNFKNFYADLYLIVKINYHD